MDQIRDTEPAAAPEGEPAPQPSPPPDAGPGSGPAAGPPRRDPITEQLRALRRSRSERVVAGVCGGVARRLDVDPLLLRVVLAVMVLFGGAGVLLYALGWLLLPTDDGLPSVGQQALHPRPGRRTSTVLLAVGLTVVVVISALAGIDSVNTAGLALLAVVGLLVWLAQGGRRPGPGETFPAPGPGDTYPAPGPGDPFPAPGPGGPPWQPGETQPSQAFAPGPPPGPPLVPPVTRPRPVLGRVTVWVVLIAVGLLLAADVAGLAVPASGYPALALLIVAAGLLVGSRYGRARGLIALGLVLSLVTAVVGAAGEVDRRFSGRTVDDRVVITRVDQIPTNADFAAGQVRYDLRGLDLTDGTAALRAQVGFGEIVVVVPPGLDVTVRARVGFGGLDVFGTSDGGGRAASDRTDVGDDGPGGGELTVDLYAGFGHLEVRRATS